MLGERPIYVADAGAARDFARKRPRLIESARHTVRNQPRTERTADHGQAAVSDRDADQLAAKPRSGNGPEQYTTRGVEPRQQPAQGARNEPQDSRRKLAVLKGLIRAQVRDHGQRGRNSDEVWVARDSATNARTTSSRLTSHGQQGE